MTSPDSSSRPPRLLEQLRERIRLKHYSVRTEQAYAAWPKRYILFHGKRHTAEMGKPVHIQGARPDWDIHFLHAAPPPHLCSRAVPWPQPLV